MQNEVVDQPHPKGRVGMRGARKATDRAAKSDVEPLTRRRGVDRSRISASCARPHDVPSVVESYSGHFGNSADMDLSLPGLAVKRPVPRRLIQGGLPREEKSRHKICRAAFLKKAREKIRPGTKSG